MQNDLAPGEKRPLAAGAGLPFWHPRSIIALLRGRAVLVAIVLLTALFVLLTAVILRGDLQPTPWDIYITREIQEFPPVVGAVLIAVSAPGFAPWSVLVPMLLVLVIAAFRRFAEAVFTTLAALGGLTAEIVKNLVDRPRPSPDLVHVTNLLNTYSFPSGHVTGYTVLFGFLFYLAFTMLPRTHPVRWLVLLICGALVVLVGLSRVYMGQHWASDAIAGYALGFVCLLVLIELHRIWLKRHVAQGSGVGD